MKKKKILAIILATAMCFTAFAGCQSSSSESSSSSSSSSSSGDTDTDDDGGVDGINVLDEGSITIFYRGDMSEIWDGVYEEFLNVTEGTLNTELDMIWIEASEYKDKLNLEITAGTVYDLVYDASWLQLKTLSSEGYYQDLSYYFGNEDYAGLYEAFSDDVMEANIWYDYMCYIPVYQVFGNGIGCVYYRQDWADEWGIGEIESYETMEEYWNRALEEELIPLSGYYFQLYSIGSDAYEGSAAAGIQCFTIGGIDVWTYTDNGELVTYAVEGSGDEAFADFPDGWNYDFTTAKFETFAEYTEAGYISPDAMTISDNKTPFDAELASSYIGTLDTYAADYARFEAFETGGTLGTFIYSESARNMEEEAIPTSYIANNGLCIPTSSSETDRTMAFINWIHSSADNHDLLEYGVEGVDWEADGDSKYVSISDYSTTWYGFGLTWSPLYSRVSSVIPDELVEYRVWQTLDTTYIQLPISGFNFDSTDMAMETAVASVNGVTSVYDGLMYGILTNGTTTFDTASDMMYQMYTESMSAGLEDILEELELQINEYLAG